LSYAFSQWPIVWTAVLIFLLGMIYRVYWIITYSKKDKVVHPYMDLRSSSRSILHWIVPFGSRNMRMRPFFTLYSFLFHIGLLAIPIFAFGHVAIWEESWGISWWHLPDDVTHILTIVVIIAGFLFLLRRIAEPSVRYVSFASDYLIWLIVMAPFITGLMAYYQLFNYDVMIYIHMITGAIWLVAIPFTRIVHMLFFPFTRAYMGSEFGFVRNARDW
jgi:nitrate reductase gamma subunit